MGFYDYNFAVLILACAFLTWRRYQRDVEVEAEKEYDDEAPSQQQKAEARSFTTLFLAVYMLVMGADWLQGPYVYALYKDEMGFSERTVAALFTTGFLSGAISGYFVGSLADRYGRRTACLVFCVTYSIACFSTLYRSAPLLFLGRVFGGASTSLMYSAFESWMVTEFHKRELNRAGASLSGIFGTMTTMNSIVAIIAGVFSEWLVDVAGTKRAPFMASACLLVVAFYVISTYWGENYGDSANKDSSVPATSALSAVLKDKRILTIGLASCFFEGSMYLFVFFWTPAMKASREALGLTASLPFGMIFACFMGSIMLGSLFFNLLVSSWGVITHGRLLTSIFAVASSSLLVTVMCKDERLTFWSFCLFEACVGMYWPSIGYLKGRIIDDGIRARVYGMLRIPLNVFVVFALSLTREGPQFRDTVFITCSGLLLLASGILNSIVAE
ncbi:MAG: hypothetical protein M1827_007659 [Pycnora praestabilis]|nr:MAG: hypothetical protein M1827_007659 [Pycnora praestabilis]